MIPDSRPARSERHPIGDLHTTTFVYQEPFKKDSCSGYRVSNEVVLGSRVNKGQKERKAAHAELGLRSVLPPRLRSQLFHLFQEVDVRLIGDSCPLHSFPQVVGIGEPPGVLQAVPLKEDYELARVIDVAQDPSSLGAASLSGGSVVVVEHRLPPLVILYLMAHKKVRYGVRPLSERTLLAQT
jgi:hypothetical protein